MNVEKERAAFEAALSKKPEAMFWNASDAMFWAWQAARKCDGNHGGPRCADPECWNDSPQPSQIDRQGRGEPVARARVYMYQGRRQFSLAELGAKAAGNLKLGVYDLFTTPQPAEPVRRKYLEGLAEADGCFRAAYIEGLTEALSETTDARLKDLIERRILYAHYAIVEAISQPAAPVVKESLTVAEPVSNSGYVCAACGAALRAGYTCDQCGSDEAADAEPVKDAVTASEAVYAFAAWLTCREQAVTFSSTHDASQPCDLANEFVLGQGWEQPRDDYPSRLKKFPAEPTTKESLTVAEPVKVPDGAQPLLDMIDTLCTGLQWNIENCPEMTNASDDEALADARALLARYGSKS